MTRFRELRLQLGLSQEQLCKQYNNGYVWWLFWKI